MTEWPICTTAQTVGSACGYPLLSKFAPPQRFSVMVWAIAVTIVFSPANARADDVNDYERHIKPLLKARCFACHGSLKQESGLRLDTGELMRQGGADGPVVTPGKPDDSPLIERISSTDEFVRMPPEGEPLTPAEVEIFRAWISDGAKSPDNEQPEDDPREHWAFRQPVRPLLPEFRQTPSPSHPVDAFIVAKLEANGLSPHPLADKPTLLRRVYLDLIGVPPTPEELQAFLDDDSAAAWATVVDGLLQDPRYGERWGRHWMDVWRYSDWYGRRHVPDVWNSAPQIWRWRDWIVESLNEDKGYDKMVAEMLAADEVRPEDRQAAYATGYLVRNWYALNPNDWMRANVEHTGKAFLGLTFNCAHCHDHKYDPIAHDDYFKLRAFFEPISLRQDRVPGEADPGMFQEYQYGVLRKIQRLGAIRVFDKTPDAPTWFYSGGDERNRVSDRGSIPPGVPAFLDFAPIKIEEVQLPPKAWYPGYDPEIQQTLLADAESAVAAAKAKLEQARSTPVEVPPAAAEQLAQAEAAYAAEAESASEEGRRRALSGKQSLIFDASNGRRILGNRLESLASFTNGFTIDFQMLLLKDAHFNFQLARNFDAGLTAAYVAFEGGRILSYQPGTFTTFEAGKYDFPAGQDQFHVRLVLNTVDDLAALTVRSVVDNAVLVDAVPIAINGWNPLGDRTKTLTFDARPGSVTVLDDVILSDGSTDAIVAKFDFETPANAAGQEILGTDGWEKCSLSVDPATSQLADVFGDSKLTALAAALDVARRAVRGPELQQKSAEAGLAAAEAELAGIEARIAADKAKYAPAGEGDASKAAKVASRSERHAALRRAEATLAEQEFALSSAESQPADAENRQKDIDAATAAVGTARTAVEKARAAAEDAESESYSPLTPVYASTSTGRRSALARWITHRQNPLTARVAVNHVWMRHFHAPLVASVYDFGRNGSPPTHPQLLDWLAVEFMDSGWSMKHLHRLLVTSDAYRRTSAVQGAETPVELDPENRLLWRMNPGRMEAEIIRDSILACGNLLDLTMGGQELESDQALKTYRRSLYYAVHPEVGGASQLSALFDAPNPLECYRRTRSVIPQQALALTNSQLVHDVSTKIVADRQAAGEAPPSDVEFIDDMFALILSRTPSDAERRICVDALAEQRNILADTDEAARSTRARESLVRALFNHNDFVTLR